MAMLIYVAEFPTTQDMEECFLFLREEKYSTQNLLRQPSKSKLFIREKDFTSDKSHLITKLQGKVSKFNGEINETKYL